MEGGPITTRPKNLFTEGGHTMNRLLGLFVIALFLSAASLAVAKDYQVTGPVLDVKDDVIVVKKGNENWEIARDKNTKTSGEVKKGDRVMIKYKMTATSIEGKEPTKAKTDAKAATDTKVTTDAKAKTEAKTK
jgi:ribosomal 50S subunit-recycling heat shock protein